MWFFDGPITGKKSGNEGLNPNHSSSCSGKSPSIYFAFLIKFFILDLVKGLSRPVIFSNRGFGITPMEQGLRVVGTVEFGGLNNPLSKSRIKNLISNAKYMLGDLPEHEDEWLGFRPSLPDFLPVMGPSKNYKNIFYCFGHHHLGWTLGPISGKIVSGMIANENTNLDLKPYSSLRFQ